LPHWPPIPRCRFHDNFLDLLLDQPFGQEPQLVGAAAELSPLKIALPFDSNIGHHHGQHLLMNIDSRYPVRHKSSYGGSDCKMAIMEDRGFFLTLQAIRKQLAAMPNDLYLVRLIRHQTRQAFP
jgi:hypothetical protein